MTAATEVVLPAWPLELENFDIARSGANVRLKCKYCGNRVGSYPAMSLNVAIHIALRHWHAECPRRLAEAGS